MGRQEAIARSIVLTLLNGTQKRASNALAWLLASFTAFFSFYQLRFEKVRPADFANLRRNHWSVKDDDYLDSFRPETGKNAEDGMKAIGDMGFSGSVCDVALPRAFSFRLLTCRLSLDILCHLRSEIPRQICTATFRVLLLPRRSPHALC